VIALVVSAILFLVALFATVETNNVFNIGVSVVPRWVVPFPVVVVVVAWFLVGSIVVVVVVVVPSTILISVLVLIPIWWRTAVVAIAFWKTAHVGVVPVLPAIATSYVTTASVGLVSFLVALGASWCGTTVICVMICLLTPNTIRTTICCRVVVSTLLPKAFRLTFPSSHFQGIKTKKLQQILDNFNFEQPKTTKNNQIHEKNQF